MIGKKLLFNSAIVALSVFVAVLIYFIFGGHTERFSALTPLSSSSTRFQNQDRESSKIEDRDISGNTPTTVDEVKYYNIYPEFPYSSPGALFIVERGQPKRDVKAIQPYPIRLSLKVVDQNGNIESLGRVFEITDSQENSEKVYRRCCFIVSPNGKNIAYKRIGEMTDADRGGPIPADVFLDRCL